MLCLTVSADATPPHFGLSLTDDSVEIDDSVYLLVDLKDNVGFAAMQFTVTYDKDKLLLEEAVLGELGSSIAVSSVNTDIIGEIHFSAISMQDIVGDGAVIVSKFKAISAGNAAFDLTVEGYASFDGGNLNSTSNDVKIAIVDPSAVEKPDIPDPPSEPDKPNKPNIPNTPEIPNEPNTPDTPEVPDEPEILDDPDTPVAPEQTDAPDEPEVSIEKTFSDVSTSHWAYSQIYDSVKRGLFTGTGENIFSPELTMTRAMFVTVLHRYSGSPSAERCDFADVEDSWYTDAVSWAVENGIVFGTGNNEFSPNKYITRGEIAAILCRYSKAQGANASLLDKFTDADTIPDWGKASTAWAVDTGLILGREGGKIAFSANATRAEAAVIFVRFLNLHAN